MDNTPPTMATAAVIHPQPPAQPPSRAPTTLERDLAIDEETIQSRLFGTPYEPNAELWAADQRAWERVPAEVKAQHKARLEQRGIPLRLDGLAVWDGKQLINEPEKWLYQIPPEDEAEVDSGLAHFKASGLTYDDIVPDTFPLGKFGIRLRQFAAKIHDGLGFVIIRGLQPSKWTREDQIAVYTGISSYIGATRLKQQDNKAIVHLRDLTRYRADQRPAITLKGQTNGNQVAHTDAGDIVGLFTLGKAETGGLSQLSSVAQAWNWLAEHRPDIANTLADPSWEWEGQEPTPLLHWYDGRLLAQYARRPWFPFYEDTQRRGDTKELEYERHIALDALHFTAERFFFDLDLQPGDLEFFNNLQVFHARTYSEDSEQNVRHLLRIWIRNEEQALKLPYVLKKRWVGLLQNKGLEWPLEAWEK